MNSVFKHKIILALAFIACTCLPFAAQAQTPAAAPCDPNYYDSLEARAWLEAQREITQNQNLIFKPDSVLEYTCFDRFLDELAEHAEDMFSETSNWSTSLGSSSMDNALNNLVGSAVNSYLGANFGHSFLGGRRGLDYSPSSISGGSYSCDRMERVWEEAKCMNFIDTPAEDGFFTFADYQADPDKRFLPNRCGAIGGRWNNEIQTALVTGGTPWTEDAIITYFGNLSPAAPNCGSLTPVATGIMVRRSTAPTTYNEKVCLAPGCRYVPTGTNTGNCQGP